VAPTETPAACPSIHSLALSSHSRLGLDGRGSVGDFSLAFVLRVVLILFVVEVIILLVVIELVIELVILVVEIVVEVILLVAIFILVVEVRLLFGVGFRSGAAILIRVKGTNGWLVAGNHLAVICRSHGRDLL